MRSFTFLAAITALVGLATAKWSNGTHFQDPATNLTIKHFGCNVHRGTASAHFNQTVSALFHKHRHHPAGSRAPRARLSKKQSQMPISIPTYFHIISTAANAGTVTPEMAMRQIQELNTAFNPYRISFTLKKISWTVNDAWSIGAGANLNAAKAALRIGTYANLNLYFHTDLDGGELGTCTLPSTVPAGADPRLYSSDGCNVHAQTMPGGRMAGYNLGKTAVHETGHWLGLLHTFEGNTCKGDGDLIADTRVEAASTDGCPAFPPKNSCPAVAGVDPIHNYMDYSTDACYEAFTPGQVQRMQSLWWKYRAPFADDGWS